MYEVDWCCLVLESCVVCVNTREVGKEVHFIDYCRAWSWEMNSRARRPIRMTRLVDRTSVKSRKPTGTLIGAEWHDFT